MDKKYHTKLNMSPGAYHILYIHGRFNISKFFNLNYAKELSVILQVDNLLDKAIWLPDWGLTIGNSIPVEQGRTLYMGWTYHFRTL